MDTVDKLLENVCLQTNVSRDKACNFFLELTVYLSKFYIFVKFSTCTCTYVPVYKKLIV